MKKVTFSSGKLKSGWIYLTVELDRFKIKLSASYLDDIPILWLNSILANLKDKIPFILKGDSEGSKFSIIESDEGLAIIIENTGGYELDCFGTIYLPEISKKELIKEVFSGIENYIEEMIDWNPGNLLEEERIKRKELLINLLKECKSLSFQSF